MKKSNLSFKFVFVGDSSVGKSCLIKRIVRNQYQNIHDVTTTTNKVSTFVRVQKQDAEISIYDTPGQSVFRATTISACRDMDCLVIVFDLSNHITFESVENWKKDLNLSDNITIAIVGNKKDQDSKSFNSNGKSFAEQHGYLYFEVSALSGENTKEMFQSCVADAYLKMNGNQEKKTEKSKCYI